MPQRHFADEFKIDAVRPDHRGARYSKKDNRVLTILLLGVAIKLKLFGGK